MAAAGNEDKGWQAHPDEIGSRRSLLQGHGLVAIDSARVLSHKGLDPSDDQVQETGAIDVFFKVMDKGRY